MLGMVGNLNDLRLVGQHGGGLSEGRGSTEYEQHEECDFHGVLSESTRDEATSVPT
jgi:hypothetical protein